MTWEEGRASNRNQTHTNAFELPLRERERERARERERIKRGIGHTLLLNNWQQERRGSEEECIEARKVVSPEYSIKYVGVSVQRCQGSHFYLLMSLTKTNYPAFATCLKLCATLCFNPLLIFIYPAKVCRLLRLLFFQQCSASHLNSCTHSHLGATPPSNVGLLPGVDQEQRSSTWTTSFDNLSSIFFFNGKSYNEVNVCS